MPGTDTLHHINRLLPQLTSRHIFCNAPFLDISYCASRNLSHPPGRNASIARCPSLSAWRALSDAATLLCRSVWPLQRPRREGPSPRGAVLRLVA